MTITSDISNYITKEIARDISPGDIPEDYDLVETGVIDSLAMVRLITWIGERFEVPINDIEISPSDFSTVGRIAAFVQRYVRAVA
jgi:acyl carrier protein